MLRVKLARGRNYCQIITKSKIVYGPNSSEYADILIEYKDSLVLVGAPKELVDNELLRLEVADRDSESAPTFRRGELLETMNALIKIDANKWEVDQYMKIYYLTRPFKDELMASDNALELSNKFINAASNIWGKYSREHLQSVSAAAFFSAHLHKI